MKTGLNQRVLSRGLVGLACLTFGPVASAEPPVFDVQGAGVAGLLQRHDHG